MGVIGTGAGAGAGAAGAGGATGVGVGRLVKTTGGTLGAGGVGTDVIVCRGTGGALG